MNTQDNRASILLHEIAHAFSFGNNTEAEIYGNGNQEEILTQYINTIEDGLSQYAKKNNIKLSEDGWDLKAISILGLQATTLGEKYAVDYAKANGVTLNKDDKNYEADVNKWLWDLTIRGLLLIYTQDNEH